MFIQLICPYFIQPRRHLLCIADLLLCLLYQYVKELMLFVLTLQRYELFFNQKNILKKKFNLLALFNI